MKRMMIGVIATLFGVAALTGCASSATDVDANISNGGVADASMMTSRETVPDWALASDDGYFEGYGFIGGLACSNDTNPVSLPADSKVEYEDGDLYFSFEGQAMPPGVVLQSHSGSWIVASFDTDGATEYRVESEEQDYTQFELYARYPTFATTCWQ